MDKEKPDTRIIEALDERFKYGATSKEIMNSLNVSGTTNERKFYNVLKSLREHKDIRFFSIGKRVIYYLPKNEKKVKLEWKIDERDIELKQELNYILTGYVFIEKQALKQGKGYVTPYEEDHWYYRDVLPYTLLPIIMNLLEENFLVFLVENLNDYPIEGVGASIFVDKYNFGDGIKKENCTLKKETNTYYIECSKLLPDETAYVAIPLKESNIELPDSWITTDRPCTVKGWYQKTSLVIREARLTEKDTGMAPCTEIEFKKMEP